MSQYFNQEALEIAYNQPHDSRDILIYMHPQDFLKVAMSGHSDEKMHSVKELANHHISFNEIPLRGVYKSLTSPHFLADS